MDRHRRVVHLRLGDILIVSHTVLLGRVVRTVMRGGCRVWCRGPGRSSTVVGGRGKVPARRVPRATGGHGPQTALPFDVQRHPDRVITPLGDSPSGCWGRNRSRPHGRSGPPSLPPDNCRQSSG